MLLKDIITSLETWAPPAYQESYDNSGLLVGSDETEIKGVLVSLDCTEEVVQEAIRLECNLIVSHHPIIFSGLKKLTNKSHVERVVSTAIKNDICLYAIHTNLDNIHTGVNAKIAERLGLRNVRVLKPKRAQLCKIAVFTPLSHVDGVREAMFASGAGHIGDYAGCSFNSEGYGTFTGNENTQAFVGAKNKAHRESETKIEVVCPSYLVPKVIQAMLSTHPYEEVAYDIFLLENKLSTVGSGAIGELETAMTEEVFLKYLKKNMELACIKYSSGEPKKAIQKVAVCGGAGMFLLKDAVALGADAFVSSDFKYHDFFDSERKLLVADIGHYESECFTIDLLVERLQKMPNFAVYKTNVVTNPIKYFL